jgi:hypothetical protein
MHCRYRAYGLSLSSNVPVPGLQIAPALSQRVDVSIDIASRRPGWSRRSGNEFSHIECIKGFVPAPAGPTLTVTTLGPDNSHELAYSDGTQFLLDGSGKHLRALFSPPFTIDDLATYLLGPVMGFILRQRGVTALHASTICVAGRAVALCGQHAAGKSTTAAALALRGAGVLCEDITTLAEEAGIFRVEPGYPRVCLWPDSVRSLLGAAEALPLLTPNWEKRYLPLDGMRASFESQSKPIVVIYLLSPRTEDSHAPSIEKITPRDALLCLVQNTYMNRLLNREQRAAEFGFLSRVVMCVPVRRIVPHADPARLGALCDLIVQDAMTLSPANSSVEPVHAAAAQPA